MFYFKNNLVLCHGHSVPLIGAAGVGRDLPWQGHRDLLAACPQPHSPAAQQIGTGIWASTVLWETISLRLKRLGQEPILMRNFRAS